MAKHLDEIKNEFERAVFLASYGSRRQRFMRLQAMALLLLGHFLRGALIGLPIYLAALLLLIAPLDEQRYWYFAILLPGVIGWSWVLIRGAWSDYCQRVRHRLLEPGFLRRLFFD